MSLVRALQGRVLTMTEEKGQNGWGRFAGRIPHYYVGTRALCGRQGFYTGLHEPDATPQEGQCRECRKRLARAQG